MSLSLQPACLPLLLGSLPHSGPAQALALSRRYAGSLLSWPQLPQRSFREQSLVQAAIGFPGLVVDPGRGHVYVDRAIAERGLERLGLAYLTHDITYAALSDEDAIGLAELIRQRDSLRGVLAIKGQLLGPISLAAQLTDENQRPLIYDNMYFEALGQHLHLRAAWQIAQLADLFPTTIMCLDEPLLDSLNLSFLPISWPEACERIDEVLAGLGGYRALYAGGASDWNQVFHSAADITIADVYNHATALVAAGPALLAFLERGGIIGLGLVPADEEVLAKVSAATLVERAEALLDDLAPYGIEREQLLCRAVITSDTMLGRLTVEMAERAVQLLADTSRLLRERYTLE